MNTSFPLLFNHDVSAEYLCTVDNWRLDDKRLVDVLEPGLSSMKQDRELLKAHPPISIYRIAAEGSQTRDGGVVKRGSSALSFNVSGQQVRAARKGDYVEYADGPQAHIITAAGQRNDHIAAVGSRLSNGDEIINTPQEEAFYVGTEKETDLFLLLYF
jgi:hypothetical protein